MKTVIDNKGVVSSNPQDPTSVTIVGDLIVTGNTNISGSVINPSVYVLLATQTEHPSARYREITPTATPFPTQILWYTNNGKTIKLVEKNYTYDINNNITLMSFKLYDGTVANTVLQTITDTITNSGPFEVSRTRVVT